MLMPFSEIRSPEGGSGFGGRRSTRCNLTGLVGSRGSEKHRYRDSK